ncbi:MAG: tetratricopeptide repeat protein [Bacteroidales bacterium]|nr:tetratricopeptide repeat protein [Bacteroidales bacterium]
MSPNLYPDDDYANFRLGILYNARDKDDKKALEQFNKAIELNDQRTDYFYNRAFVYRRTKNYTAAVDDFTHYLGLRPKNATVHGYRADCYEKLGELSKAEEDYKLALQYAPGNSLFTSKLAGIAAKSGAPIESSEDNVELLLR